MQNFMTIPHIPLSFDEEPKSIASVIEKVGGEVEFQEEELLSSDQDLSQKARYFIQEGWNLEKIRTYQQQTAEQYKERMEQLFHDYEQLEQKEKVLIEIAKQQVENLKKDYRELSESRSSFA